MALLPEDLVNGQIGRIADTKQAWRKLNGRGHDVRADYGAVGDGTTNDTTAVQAAFTACPDGGVIIFPSGYNFRVTSITLGNKAVTILAHGATITAATAGTFAFVQSNRKRTTWHGGTITGSGSGFKLDLSTSSSQSYDFSFNNVTFDLPANQKGLHLKGGREGTITNCFFDNCTGIYLYETVNTHITGCQFRNCTKGVHGDGQTASAYNAGIMINNATMLGCGVGVHVLAHDWVNITNSMIDFCDQPVLLVNQDIALIQGLYTSNREYSSTASPTIQIVTDGAQPGESTKHVRIANCSIVNNVTSLPQLAKGIKFSGGVDWCSVTNCSIHFWRKYGIEVTGTSTYMKFVGNDLVRVGAESGAASIYGTNGNDSTWLIGDNYLSVANANLLAPVTRNNFT